MAVLPSVLLAQQNSRRISFTGTSHGLYISFSDVAIPKSGFRLFRIEDKKEPELIASFITAASSNEFQYRMTRYAGLFPGYALPSARMADTLWKVWNKPDSAGLFVQMAVPIIQLSLGLSVLDTTAHLGNTYRYQLAVQGESQEMTSEPIRYEEDHPVFSPISTLLADPGERQVHIEWATTSDNAAPLFEVYRKVAGSTLPFSRLTTPVGIRNSIDGDSVIYLMTDTTSHFGIRYDYYLQSKDLIGNTGNCSDTVSVQSGGRRNLETAFNINTQAVNQGIRIYWDPLSKTKSAQNILVMRSELYDDGYTLVATVPTTDSDFVDNAIRAGKSYYYQLLVQGESNISRASPRVSGIYHGAVRLLPPQNLSASSKGNLVRLEWSYTDSLNVSGFYLYRSFTSYDKPQLVSGLIPLKPGIQMYTDTNRVAELTHAHYMVAAVSTTQSLGPPSDEVSVLVGLADSSSRVATPSGMRFLWLSDTVVSITWRDLQRSEYQVAGYHVYKKAQKNDSLVLLTNLVDQAMNEYVDTIPPGKSRWYSVKAFNLQGKESAFGPILQIDAPLNKPLPPSLFTVAKDHLSVLLSWNQSENIVSYQVYRSDGNHAPRLIGKVKPSENELSGYEDANLAKGNYYYYVTSINNKGIESDFSKEISVSQP